MIPFIGFAPDLDPTTPGVMTQCFGIVPTEDGFESLLTTIAVPGVPNLAAPVLGAAILKPALTGGDRILAGTQNALYSLVGGAWSNVSRVGGYNGTELRRWQFAQFGDVTIAANYIDNLQAATTGAFADIPAGGSLKAAIVVTSANFVLVFDFVEASTGFLPDGWWCSALNDHTSWAPSVATQAARGRLVGESGAVTAAMRLGARIIAFKQRAMYVGTYVGPPVVWQWEQLPGTAGCVGPGAVCDVGGALVFCGQTDIYIFDGAHTTSIGTGVRQWLRDTMLLPYAPQTMVAFDQNTRRVFVFFASVPSAFTTNRALVYHLDAKRWGHVDTTVATVATFGPISNFADNQALITFDNLNLMGMYRGTAPITSFTTGWYGSNDRTFLVRTVRLHWQRLPQSASIIVASAPAVGTNVLTSPSSNLVDGHFDVKRSNRWHQFIFSMITGPTRFNALSMDGRAGGRK